MVVLAVHQALDQAVAVGSAVLAELLGRRGLQADVAGLVAVVVAGLVLTLSNH